MIALNAVKHNYTTQIAGSSMVKTVKSESELKEFCEVQIRARALFSEAQHATDRGAQPGRYMGGT